MIYICIYISYIYISYIYISYIYLHIYVYVYIIYIHINIYVTYTYICVHVCVRVCVCVCACVCMLWKYSRAGLCLGKHLYRPGRSGFYMRLTVWVLMDRLYVHMRWLARVADSALHCIWSPPELLPYHCPILYIATCVCS